MGYGIVIVIFNVMLCGCIVNVNLIMEIFEQIFVKMIGDISVNNFFNCFFCYSVVGFVSGSLKLLLYLSYVFDGYLQLSQGIIME